MNGVGVYTLKHSITTKLHPMKNILLLMGIALLLLVAAAHVTAAPPIIQFRLVVDNPTADSEPMTVVQPDNSPRQPGEVLNVQKAALLDSSDMKNASVMVENRGKPKIDIKFTDDGAKRFAEVTRQNIGKRLAIVIDGKLNSAPRIESAITGGRAEITGHFTQQEAENLAARINGSPVQAHKALNWSRIGFYCFALLFVATLGIAVWVAIRRKDASPAT